MDKNTILNYVMNTPENTNLAILGNMLDSFGEGGGESGYLGIHTVTANVTFDTSEIDGNVNSIASIDLSIQTDIDVAAAIYFQYGSYDNHKISIAELGTPTQMLIPVIDGYITALYINGLSYNAEGGFVTGSTATVIDGDAEILDGYICITGDCSLNIKVVYQD